MKKTLTTLSLALCSSIFLAQAAVLAQYDFNNTQTPLEASLTDAGVTAGTLSSPDFNLTSSVISSRLNINEPRGIEDGTDNNINGAHASGQYIEFTLTAATGFLLNLDNITFDISQSNRGVQDYAIRTSVDSFATNIGFSDQGIPRSGTLAARTIDFSDPAFDALSTITIRLVLDNRRLNGDGDSNVFIDNLTANGNILVDPSVIPEPSTAALLALAGLALFARRSRKK